MLTKVSWRRQSLKAAVPFTEHSFIEQETAVLFLVQQ